MKYEFLDADSNVVTTVNTDDPQKEFEYFRSMLPQIQDYRECVELVPTLDDLKTEKLTAIKAALTATDYKCLKYVDGDLSAEEYSTVKSERKVLRDKYNAIEAAESIEDLNEITGGE